MSRKQNCAYCHKPVELRYARKCGEQYVFHKECYELAKAEMNRLQLAVRECGNEPRK